jgi:hypothetical protein
MSDIYNAPESKLDRRNDYHRKILGSALERTAEKYGAFQISAVEVPDEYERLKDRKFSKIEIPLLSS